MALVESQEELNGYNVDFRRMETHGLQICRVGLIGSWALSLTKWAQVVSRKDRKAISG